VRDIQVFCEVAYKAKSSKDIVAGIDEYAEDLTVLPPSVWDPAIRIEPPERSVHLVSTLSIPGTTSTATSGVVRM